MKIAYYMPFKPLGHANPSGDLITGTEIYDYLRGAGHQCELASELRCRWIYYRPALWPQFLGEQRRIVRQGRRHRPDLWLTYHSYYKAPDLLGCLCAHRLQIPYIIFQGIYSTKKRKKLKTLPGFYLNRRCLVGADLVFTNKKRDRRNLLRLLPEQKVCYIPPGIHSARFTFDARAREELRARWNIEGETVILSAAMFRPGVKTRGLRLVIESCARLAAQQHNIRLVIAGDGSSRDELHRLADELLPNRVLFAGRIQRDELYRYYSAADIFAFPGIEESLGMVYLEAQSCGLPVVAYSDWGGSETVIPEQTGLLTSSHNPEMFTENIGRLIADRPFSRQLGGQGAAHIRDRHELRDGYSHLEAQLHRFADHPRK